MRRCRHSLDVGDQGCEYDSASPVYKWSELLHREKRSIGVHGEHLVVGNLGNASERRWDAEPGADGEQIEGVELGLHPTGEGCIADGAALKLLRKTTIIYANPTVRFVIGGPDDDAVLTGSKSTPETLTTACQAAS
jgi:hypothetical protein